VRPLDHLMARALSGDADYVRAALRDNPGLLGERDMFGSGVAHAAVYGGHPELLDLPEFSGWPADIITAAELGDTAAVGWVLAADPALATALVGATTALHAAAYWGQPAVARLLLGAGAGGADPAATAVSGPHAGQTPADTALSQGHLVMIPTGSPRFCQGDGRDHGKPARGSRRVHHRARTLLW
jgi:ankyrin repeat protein